MGCVKSKKSDLTQKANSVERLDGKAGVGKEYGDGGGEKAILVESEAVLAQESPRINPILLEYAQRLSEEIVARAVQQWIEVDSRYSDIPYIECDIP